MSLVTRGLGIPESPLSTSGLGLTGVSLEATLTVEARLIADLYQDRPGRKKKKKAEQVVLTEPNPLVRVRFGEPKKVEEVAVVPAPLPSVVETKPYTEERRPAELVPDTKFDLDVDFTLVPTEEVAVDDLRVKQKKAPVVDDFYDDEIAAAILLMLDD